jgi:hypothetical protein
MQAGPLERRHAAMPDGLKGHLRSLDKCHCRHDALDKALYRLGRPLSPALGLGGSKARLEQDSNSFLAEGKERTVNCMAKQCTRIVYKQISLEFSKEAWPSCSSI